MLVLVAFDDGVVVQRIADAHQPAAKRRSPNLATTVTHHTPGAGRKANRPLVLRCRVRRQPHEHFLRVGHPDVTRRIFSQALDVRDTRVHELEDILRLLVNAGCGTNPEVSGAILVQAERLGAVVAVALSSQRPAVVGELEQPATSRHPDRTLSILNHRGHAGRRAVGSRVLDDLAALDTNHPTPTADSNPDAAVVRSDDRVHGTAWQPRRRIGRLPRREAIAVEAKKTRGPANPEIPFQVLRDGEYVPR